MAKKPNLVSPIDILGPLVAKMHINHKLYEGHHFRDVPLGENIGKMKEKVLETILESELETALKGQSSSTMLLKSEILNKTIWSYKDMLTHLYEKQQLGEQQLQGT